MADAFTSETYNALCRDAEGYLARGLAEQARELLLKATSLIGTRPRARSLLADACMQLGLWSEAKAQLEALATLEVDNIYTHFRLGQVLEETGDHALARDNFRVVLDMNPDHHGAKVALARLEKSSGQETEKKPKPTEGTQIFADDQNSAGVFAGGESDGEDVDELLSSIGIGEKKDVPGVDDLLDSIGIDKEEKKKEEPRLDFNSIFGREESSDSAEEQSSEAPLAGVFGSGESEEGADLSSIFGAPAEEPEPEAPEEEPAAGEEPWADADLSSIFGAPAEEPEPEAPEEEPAAGEEPRADADLSSIFGAPAEEPEPEAPEEEPPAGEEPRADADLSAVFSFKTEEEEEPKPETEPEATAEPEKPEDRTDLSSIFGAPAEEPEPEAPEEEPPAGEEPRADADLSSIFGAPAEEPEPETPEEEPPAGEEPRSDADLSAVFSFKTEEEEEPQPDTEPEATAEPEKPEDRTDLSSIFGAPAEEPEPEAPEEEPPAGEEPRSDADLSSIFGAPAEEPEPETPEEEPAAGEEPRADADLSAMSDSEAEPAEDEPDTAQAEQPEASEDEPAEPAEEDSAGGDADHEVQITVNVPVEDDGEEDSREEAPAVVEQTAEYSLLPGDGNSLCGLKLEAGRVRVIRALVASMASGLELNEGVLEGEGMAWLGQGGLTPVTIDYASGMTVRIDRIGAMPLELSSEALGIATVPSLRRLTGNGNCSLLMFVSGRYKKIEAEEGLRIRAGSVLAAAPAVEFFDDDGDFLAVSGEGPVYITA